MTSYKERMISSQENARTLFETVAPDGADLLVEDVIMNICHAISKLTIFLNIVVKHVPEAREEILYILKSQEH